MLEQHKGSEDPAICFGFYCAFSRTAFPKYAGLSKDLPGPRITSATETFRDWNSHTDNGECSLICLKRSPWKPVICGHYYYYYKAGCHLGQIALMGTTRSPWDMEVCVSYCRACDVWLAGWRGDFAILYLAQSLALVPYGIDANDCQCVKPNGNRKWIPYPLFLSKN
jgi:hypothetical protein